MKRFLPLYLPGLPSGPAISSPLARRKYTNLKPLRSFTNPCKHSGFKALLCAPTAACRRETPFFLSYGLHGLHGSFQFEWCTVASKRVTEGTGQQEQQQGLPIGMQAEHTAVPVCVLNASNPPPSTCIPNPQAKVVARINLSPARCWDGSLRC